MQKKLAGRLIITAELITVLRHEVPVMTVFFVVFLRTLEDDTDFMILLRNTNAGKRFQRNSIFFN